MGGDTAINSQATLCGHIEQCTSTTSEVESIPFVTQLDSPLDAELITWLMDVNIDVELKARVLSSFSAPLLQRVLNKLPLAKLEARRAVGKAIKGVWGMIYPSVLSWSPTRTREPTPSTPRSSMAGGGG